VLPPPYSITDIETLARIEIPSSATDVQSYVDLGGMDSFVALRFLLPAAEMEDFLSDVGCTESLEPVAYVSTLFYGLDDKISGWPSRGQWKSILADKSHVLMGCEQSAPGFSRKIIVDQSQTDIYTIYLIHFEL